MGWVVAFASGTLLFLIAAAVQGINFATAATRPGETNAYVLALIVALVGGSWIGFTVPEAGWTCDSRVTRWAIGITPSLGSPPNTRGNVAAESGSDCLEAGWASRVSRIRIRDVQCGRLVSCQRLKGPEQAIHRPPE